MIFEITSSETLCKIAAMILKASKSDYSYIRYRQALYFQDFHLNFSPDKTASIYLPLKTALGSGEQFDVICPTFERAHYIPFYIGVDLQFWQKLYAEDLVDPAIYLIAFKQKSRACSRVDLFLPFVHFGDSRGTMWH